jgi:hypothetical protein
MSLLFQAWRRAKRAFSSKPVEYIDWAIPAAIRQAGRFVRLRPGRPAIGFRQKIPESFSNERGIP